MESAGWNPINLQPSNIGCIKINTYNTMMSRFRVMLCYVWIFGNIISVMIIEDRLFTGAITVKLILESFQHALLIISSLSEQSLEIQV